MVGPRMIRLIKLALLIVCLLGIGGFSAFAASHVRPPEVFRDANLASSSRITESEQSFWAAVQAIGSIVAIFVAIGINMYSHYRDDKVRRQENRDHVQRIISGLYVEVFARAARCARDAHTWRNEVLLEKKRGSGEKVGKRRIVKELLKFEPSAPVVYPALAESHGMLEPEVQARLSEFYYRLEAVNRDIQRFTLRKLESEIEPADTIHLARCFYDACVSADDAITELRKALDSHVGLDQRLNITYDAFYKEPTPLGDSIDEVLAQVTSQEPPSSKLLQAG